MSRRRPFMKKAGIKLDLGCGEAKQEGFVGMDVRRLPGVDIVHDIERLPWPIDDNSCLQIMCSHLIEYIKPWMMIPVMDEMWRVMLPQGQLAIAVPYAGSPGFWQDPTHCNGTNEATWQYFDPAFALYGIYKPRPWKIAKGFPVWQVTGNMEVLMSAIKEGA